MTDNFQFDDKNFKMGISRYAPQTNCSGCLFVGQVVFIQATPCKQMK